MSRLLVNPVSGRGRAARLATRLSGLAGLEVRTVGSPAELTLEARRAADDGLDRVLVAGGDGTLHHAIRGLAGSDCALAIVPGGTGNDLARALGIARDPMSALRRGLEGRRRRIDLGRVGEIPFAGVLGIGLDGEVNRFIATRVRRLPPAMVYPYAVLRTLVAFRPPTVSIRHDGGGTFRGPAILAALANSPRFGGGMKIAPEASLDDGRLDLVVIEPFSMLGMLLTLPRVYRGGHLGHPRVRWRRVRSAEVRCDRALPFFADGEALPPAGPDPTPVHCWPRALDVIV